VTCGLAEETEKKAGEESHKPLYSITTWRRHFATDLPKFGEFIDLTEVITPAKVGSKNICSFFQPRGVKKHFPFRQQMS